MRLAPHVLFVDHTQGSGRELFRLACQLDLEGIVAKRADSDNARSPHWIKIKNPVYSQKEGRAELFKQAWRRGRDLKTLQPQRLWVPIVPHRFVVNQLQMDRRWEKEPIKPNRVR